jgi:uncharacterized alkaline shock family protein YloU
MTDVAYNSPQYGYGTGVPPQPVPPPPMPLPSEEPGQSAVASYDVDPSPGHAPPAVVPPVSVSFDKPESDEPADEPAPAEVGAVAPAGAVDSDSVDSDKVDSDRADGTDDEPVTPTSTSGRVAVQVVDRMRSTAERGTTTVPTPVIEKIATLAVREVPGVYDFATAPVDGSGSVAEGGDGADGERALTIEVDGKSATVTLHLVIEYGFAVHSVTEKVRTKVISALENLFSLDITAVDIVIDDIHLEEVTE